jgi:hypothetical protein
VIEPAQGVEAFALQPRPKLTRPQIEVVRWLVRPQFGGARAVRGTRFYSPVSRFSSPLEWQMLQQSEPHARAIGLLQDDLHIDCGKRRTRRRHSVRRVCLLSCVR